MTLKRLAGAAGRVVVLQHQSRVLVDNPLGDPYERPLPVWLPPQYDQAAGAGRGQRFPVLFDLVGFTGSGPAHVAWRGFDENVPERAARLIHQHKMGPCIIVFPDCFTALGGNQYINSSAIGRYADYLTRELIPFVDREFRTLAAREHRACFGKSSGGYGALIHAMKYTKYWGAIADHSGDAGFEFVYRYDWPNSLDELAKLAKPARKAGPIDVPALERDCANGLDDGRVKRFLDRVWRAKKLNTAQVHCLMNLAMAASYDPDPRAPNGFRLPCNLETGEFIPARWRQWLKHDPVEMVARYREPLKRMRGIYIDCGWRDQYRIHLGSRILSKRLHAHGIDHVYEEFDDTHSGIDYRMDTSLPFLYRAIAA